MSQVVSCPHCQGQIQNSPAIAGQVVGCPLCGQQFQMPGMSIVAVPASVPVIQAESPLTFSTTLHTRRRPQKSNNSVVAVATLVLVLAGGAFAAWRFYANPTAAISPHQPAAGGNANGKSLVAPNLGRQDISKKVSKPAFRKELFEKVLRAATELEAVQGVGINRQDFGKLLQQFATEIALVNRKATTEREKQIVEEYTILLEIYKDSAKVWDVQIEIPRIMKNWVDSAFGQFTQATRDGMPEMFAKSLGGIPLNVRDGGNTGLDKIVTRYRLPVSEKNGWKTIPFDSVQTIWGIAKGISSEIAELQES